jgi:iron complex transport system permease protein
VIVILALRLREASAARQAPPARVALRPRCNFAVVATVAAVLLAGAVLVGLLAGSLWLRLGDIGLWLQGAAPQLIGWSLDERSARVACAVLAGAALGLAGTVVQSTVRNPLAEPGVLGITAGAGLGAVMITTLSASGGRSLLIASALAAGLGAFCLIAALAWRGGLLPDRFLLLGIGCGHAVSSVSTYLLLRSDPWDTPRLLTWLSGTTWGRSFSDAAPVALALVLATPAVAAMSRQLDLLAIDEDTPRIFGVHREAARLCLLAIAAAVAAVSVVAIGVVGFVGLVAPHMARALVGARHERVVPVAMLLGASLVCLADTLGRCLIAPSQLPAGLMMALIGAPYFVWLLRRA